jgi:hypothetical protein
MEGVEINGSNHFRRCCCLKESEGARRCRASYRSVLFWSHASWSAWWMFFFSLIIWIPVISTCWHVILTYLSGAVWLFWLDRIHGVGWAGYTTFVGRTGYTALVARDTRHYWDPHGNPRYKEPVLASIAVVACRHHLQRRHTQRNQGNSGIMTRRTTIKQAVKKPKEAF